MRIAATNAFGDKFSHLRLQSAPQLDGFGRSCIARLAISTLPDQACLFCTCMRRAASKDSLFSDIDASIKVHLPQDPDS